MTNRNDAMLSDRKTGELALASDSCDADLDNVDPKLDSAYFIAIEMAHGTLIKGLRNASDLNVTQYRVLVKTLAVSPDSIQLGELSTLLRLKANVITAAVDTLERQDLVERRRSTDDARARLLRITEQGIAVVKRVDKAVVTQLYADFPTDNPLYRKSLEAAIIAGGAIEPPLSKQIAMKYPSSRTLVSIELVKQTIERTLRDATGASYNECRILQRLGEVGRPLRPLDLAEQLMLPPVTITRATDRLASRGWVKRLSDPDDRKAVHVALTDSGTRESRSLENIIDDVAYECYWSKLDSEHQQALCKVGRIAVADRHQREAEAFIGVQQTS